jgi:hypothetical protein
MKVCVWFCVAEHALRTESSKQDQTVSFFQLETAINIKKIRESQNWKTDTVRPKRWSAEWDPPASNPGWLSKPRRADRGARARPGLIPNPLQLTSTVDYLYLSNIKNCSFLMEGAPTYYQFHRQY